MKLTETALAHDLTIIGLALRTRPETAMQDIPALWGRFYQEGLAQRLAAVEQNVYAVYCDYERDFRGAYTMVLGMACAADADISDGLRRVRVPAGRFATLAVSGDPAEVVWRGWSQINGEWPDKAQRRYVADFERYRRVSLGDVDAEICVGMLA